MSQFATSTELATLLRRTFTADEIAAADLLLELVTGEIQEHTAQRIELVENDVVTLHGNYTRELTLPQWPVVAVSEIKLNGSAVPAGTWLLAGNKLYRGNLPIFNGPDDWGGDMFVTSWLGPQAAVEVTYTHGFAAIPNGIRGICLRAAARAFDRPEGASSETIGNYSYTRESGETSDFLTDADRERLDRLMVHP